MEFKLSERLHFIQKLPKDDNFVKNIIINSIRTKLEIKIEDIEKGQMSDINGGVSWEQDFSVDIYFTPKVISILTDIVEDMDSQGEITISLIDICTNIFEN